MSLSQLAPMADILAALGVILSLIFLPTNCAKTENNPNSPIGAICLKA